MTSSFRPITLHETSLRINLLHKILAKLGFPVAEEEEKTNTAGESTLRSVRAWQAAKGRKAVDNYLVDAATYQALKRDMAENGQMDRSDLFVVRGTVYDLQDRPLRGQLLMALDVDLRGAGIYRTVSTMKDVAANGGFEFLGETQSTADGYYYIEFYSFQFAAAERKKADVIVFAVNGDGVITGRSRLVNSEDYSAQGEVQRLDVYLVAEEEGTEYGRLTDLLLPFLEESQVQLLELSKSADQVRFAASELDADAGHIQLVADAAALTAAGDPASHQGIANDGLSPELLYGLARQGIRLNWLVLFTKTDTELADAIKRSVSGNIIHEPDGQQLSAFLQEIHAAALSYSLTHKEKDTDASLQEMLSLALPETSQQTDFLAAYRDFNNQARKDPAEATVIDYAKFWSESLPNTPAFRDNPALIKNLLFSQQVTAITGSFQPMMQALQADRQVGSVDALVALTPEDWKALVERTGVPDFITHPDPGSSNTPPADPAAAYASHLQSIVATAYPSRTVAHMVSKGQLSLKDPLLAPIVQAFLDQNPGFDIGISPVHEYVDELQELAKEKYTVVKQELNRLQRVFQVSPTPAAMGVLLDKNLDSAYTIASIPKSSFLQLHGEALGSIQLAEAVYQRAQHVSTLAAERAMKMYDLSHLAAPALAFSAEDRSSALKVLQDQVSKRHNPNYSEIFGSPDMCECGECRSMYSAAAYMVDLLRYLWRGHVNIDGKSPLDMFTLRRPDLLHLPLTCENTNTIIPYIDLVNEILEYYTYHGVLDKGAAYDTGDTTAAELRANPQNFEPEAYRLLKQSVYPFSLPYHQPLDVIRTYSDHLQTERFAIMRALQLDFSPAAVRAIEAEALRLSEEEYRVLTLKDFNGGPDLDDMNPAVIKPTRQLQQYYGFPASAAANPELDPVVIANMESLAGIGVPDGIHEFLRRTGIKYTDLVELIKTKFVNPFQGILTFLEQLVQNATIDASAIYVKLQNIKGGADPAADPDIAPLLAAAGIPPADFSVWVQAHFDDFNAVLTLYQSDSACDLNTTYLKTIINVYSANPASGVPNTTWSKMHRFIRLWRRLGWQIHEVDLMLDALGQSDITDAGITHLSYVVLLNRELKLPLNKLATLWGSIDTYGDSSLYKSLFLNRAVQRIDSAFHPDAFGNYLTDPAKVLKDHIPAMLAAFRMSEDDLDAILEVARINDNGFIRPIALATDKLNIYNLSVIYRYTLLSKALKQKVPDCCLLMQLFDINPFSELSIPAPAIPPVNPSFTKIEPSRTYAFQQLAASIKAAGFKAINLQYIFTGGLPPESTLGLSPDKARQTARDIRNAFSIIEQTYPATPPAPLTADMLRALLSLSFTADVVSQMIAIIVAQPGSPVYAVITDANLVLAIPDPLSAKYTYIKASGRLVASGVMSDTEKALLKALLPLNANYVSAIEALYAMPESFIKTNFSGVFAAANAITPDIDLITLLDHPAQLLKKTPEEKMLFVYSNYLPLLKKKLHEDVTTEHIASLIGLSHEATGALLRSDLPALMDAIDEEGFSADYFFNTTFTGPAALTRTDKRIAFDWGIAPDPLLPANNFSVRWQGFVSPPSTGEYTLVVDVKEADESFSLYLDDALILQKLALDPRTSWEVIAQLNAAQLHMLVLEYVDSTGTAGITLSWKTATTAVTPVPSAAAFPVTPMQNITKSMLLYHRAAIFITGFTLTDTEVIYLAGHPADFGNIDFKALTAAHWQRIAAYVSLRKTVPQGQALLTDVFAAANIANPVPVIPDLINQLYLATAWDLSTLTYLVNTYFAVPVNDFKNEIALTRLYKAVSFVLKTGLSPQTLALWAAPETLFDKLNATADLVKSTVKAKYEEEDWLQLAGNLSDKIRSHQQQALIGYLLTRPELKAWGATDADGLFEYFLIDVQMGSCMDTSRIVQANAAIQMFVNRCLLNLESKKIGFFEKGVSPGALDRQRWDWMQNYRVWEANKKIFLYPENWLEPEWRDDRSVFFKELESELTQNDITLPNVETAFRNYLNKLNTVANLDVCGLHQENYFFGPMRYLHVFGRTHSAPYQFFYRTCDQFFKWSAWEKVQVDIKVTEEGDNSGVQLAPIIWKNRLFIFWPEFLRRQVENTAKNSDGNNSSFKEIGDSSPGNIKPIEYYECRLAWSEYVDGKWSTKQLTKEFITSPVSYPGQLSQISVLMDIVGGDALIIWLQDRNRQFGNFGLTDIQAQMYAWSYNGSGTPKLGNYANFFMSYENYDVLKFKDNIYLQNVTFHKLLLSTEVFDFESRFTYPFFFSAYNRTYFVRTFDVTIWEYLKYPQQYRPIMVGKLADKLYQPQNIPPIGPDDRRPVEQGLRDRNTFAHDLQGSGIKTYGKMLPNMPAQQLPAPSVHTQMQLYQGVETAPSFAYNVNSYEYWYLRLTKGLEFHTFYHPFSSQYVTNLNNFGIDGLMNTDTFLNILGQPFFNDYGTVFTGNYNPNFSQGLVKQAPLSNDYVAGAPYTYYKENICFDLFGANNMYNWELFFHAPLYIATRLSRNGKYEEALKWFQYIFDPTTDELPAPGQSETSRYWKVLPFKTTPSQSLEDWFKTIGLGPNTNPAAENSIVAEWRQNPFKPFVVARNRPIAFMKNVVIKYVETLREWGDSLFRQFTRESVNEALQLYVMASHILGPRPEFVPKRGNIKAETYDSLKNKWDDLGNALVELENIFPYSSSVPSGSGSTSPSLLGIGPSLYFCIPSNDKLMEHWDTVADRLYKIRHCMDIDGVQRQLALFAPPIDPGMLINAAAQGISLGSILSDLSSPPPIYRFNHLLQRANEFCSEVRSLGNALLTALEKKDGEELARLHATQETSMLQLMTGIKERQILQARSDREGLLRSRDTAAFRLAHFKALFSDEGVTLPAPPTIDADVNGDTQLPPDTDLKLLATGVDESLVDSDNSGLKIISKEKEEFDKATEARNWMTAAGAADTLAGILNMIVQGEVDGKPLGVGAGVAWGGINLGNASAAVASGLRTIGQFIAAESTQAARIAGYVRREQDWVLQANLAAKEIKQLDRQITSADIRIQIAQKELSNHQRQIENAQAVEDFLHTKFTGQELYQWMKEQLFSVYKQSFNMAYDMAKKVEKCYQYELGVDITSFIQYGYWDNSMQGLCSGERLQQAIRQMEVSYIGNNQRELELNKNISLALLNPLALEQLRATGKCFVTLPEELFDLDYQGHYFRRIKSVSLSIPCIAGPYTTVSCTLRLLRNSVRVNTSMNDSGTYEHNNDEGVPTDDVRFRESNVPVKSIAASTGQRDTGMFELNFRDERYLPFEGAGAVSDWVIGLTEDPALRQFDYATISDVILHINYTAREDAGLFRDSVVTYLKDFLSNAAALTQQPLVRMFSMKHDFPTEWHKFLFPAVAGADQVLAVTLRKDNFSFLSRDREIMMSTIEIIMKANRTGDYKVVFTGIAKDASALTSAEVTMPENPAFANMQRCTLSSATPGANIEDLDCLQKITMKFRHTTDVSVPQTYNQIDTDPEELMDLFVVFHYSLG
ncbi:neuraminidase-like domain-containing protein [Flavitalea sp. BT771]|uniref:Tc toxin subunit A-related protein n=1 Tax=Flavitalea sp. BT771 TaxID=3063329 RepID=UPI0026E3EEA4|nr:neuraminidase-like domain-containing protein [Flavitalea sp. BT771]MDO6433173.1 neuraminidase-like domain-containing protein [Flavitalea sp. BT771]MDV6221551.1 neuraminidase-like domain-containing protein [Flavitalea sp. BT771]